MSFNITVEGGTSVRLPTEGKYCDRDIVITATGSGTAPEDLDSVLSEQEALIATLQDTLRGKSSGEVQYEVWTITYTDGTVEDKEVALL